MQLNHPRFFLFFCSCFAFGAEELPNVVIIFADDLGFGDLGCYGHPTSHTPNLDQLAREGLKLTSFYTSSPVCSPSRGSILTGRLFTRIGVWPHVFTPSIMGGLPKNETTIAGFLKQKSYSTSIIGKWHLGVGKDFEHVPGNGVHGFDFYTGIPYSHDMPNPQYCWPGKRGCWPDTDVDPWFDATLDDVRSSPIIKPRDPFESTDGWVSLPLFLNQKIVQQPANITAMSEYYLSHVINQLQATTDPKFVYFAPHQIHHPAFASRRFFNSSIRGMAGDHLKELDWMVGEIMKVIRALERETLVFFTSDNGPSLVRLERGGTAGILKCGKGTNWEGGQRVPAIAWWPGKIAPGQSNDIMSTMDLLPTILSRVNLKLPSDRYYDGLDQSQLLFETKPSPREEYYYFAQNPSPDQPFMGMMAARWKQWKLHFQTIGSHSPPDYDDSDCAAKLAVLDVPLLFNLDHDPGERVRLQWQNNSFYEPIVSRIKTMASGMLKTPGLYGKSQMHDREPDNQPCCNAGCAPHPQCCTCNLLAEDINAL